MKSVFIREYRVEDFDAVTILWRIAREKSLPEFQRAKGHFFFEDRDYFSQHVVGRESIWVADHDGRVAAFMAMNGEFIDHLYVHPDYWRKGVGELLLKFAKVNSSGHLWLYTLQINRVARTFYEKNGFVAEKLGISPPPENEPDVEYHWRKD